MKSCIQRDKKREWCSQQNQLLKQLYPNFSSKKWKKISQIFRQKGFERSELQIRERWTNFQDPNLLFTQWTEEQLQTLYRSYIKFGSKWCFIKRMIPGRYGCLYGRTENKIKNKFYGNIRIFLRFVVNYFNNSKEDTMWIHKINPSILNDIYKGTQEFSSFGNEMEVAIQEMNYSVDKIKLLLRIEAREEKYREFYNRVIQLYKTIESKKQTGSYKSQRRQVSVSEAHIGSMSEEEEPSGREEKSQKQKSEKRVPQYEVPLLSYQYISEPKSMMSQLDPNPASMVFTRQPNSADSTSFPLLHFHSIQPYYPSWFYPQ